jgi:membrane protease YdiL (CAAX protease family)
MINTPIKELEKHDKQIHPFVQLLAFSGIFIAIMIAGLAVGAGVVIALYGLKSLSAFSGTDTTSPHFIGILWILQIFSTTLPILLAPIVFAKTVVNNVDDYIKPTFRFLWFLPLLVLAIMFFSNPVIEFLSNLNQKMVLPHFLHWMRDSEDQAQKVTEAMLNMKTIWDMILDLLLIGLLTAIAEEFMFRGVIQTIFVRWTKNVHVAVWLTAILFSAFHMEFFGFLPRLMLGVLFGYFTAWSGSIWPAVWAHFLNNGTAVVVTYLSQHKLIKINPDDQHLFGPIAYLISLAIMLFLLFVYHMAATQKHQIAQE